MDTNPYSAPGQPASEQPAGRSRLLANVPTSGIRAVSATLAILQLLLWLIAMASGILVLLASGTFGFEQIAANAQGSIAVAVVSIFAWPIAIVVASIALACFINRARRTLKQEIDNRVEIGDIP
jgi:hypothetical protein